MTGSKRKPTALAFFALAAVTALSPVLTATAEAAPATAIHQSVEGNAGNLPVIEAKLFKKKFFLKKKFGKKHGHKKHHAQKHYGHDKHHGHKDYHGHKVYHGHDKHHGHKVYHDDHHGHDPHHGGKKIVKKGFGGFILGPVVILK